MTVTELTSRLSSEFTPKQAKLLAHTITEASQEHITMTDFTELKEIVTGLARTTVELVQAQKRTDSTVAELVQAQKRTETKVEELAEAQKRTETKVEELADAQKRTETAIAALAESHQGLIESQRQLQQAVGSLSETVSLSLEDEAYRYLPAFLEREHNITVTKRMIRQYLDGEEIDFLAEGQRGKTNVLVVGEAKTTLSAHDLTQLKRKVEAVKSHYKRLNGREIVPLMIVRRAREREMKRAKSEKIIVVQNYEL